MCDGRRERIEGYGKDADIHHRIKVEGKPRTSAQAAGADRSGAPDLQCVFGGEFETADADAGVAGIPGGPEAAEG